MKNLLSFLFLALMFSQSVNAIEMPDLVDKQELREKIEKELLKLDVGFNVDLGSIDIIDGINLSSKYRYVVEPSYQDKYFTRIDKWDLNGGINAGTILKDVAELPFSFNISRNNSFIFVRQFQSKVKALDALPYDPHRLPITASRALKLQTGDFVSIPANLNLGFSASAGTNYVMPAAVVNAGVSAFFVVSGEFTIQVFKLDETHVRLKLISSRSLNGGGNANLNADINFAGFRIFADKSDANSNNDSGFGGEIAKQVDKQLQKETLRFVDRLVDREFVNFGINYNPGASYIVDYVFDLCNQAAVEAYNQILSSAYKLKDVIVINHFLDGRSLKDKLLTTTYLADQLADQDRNLPNEQKSVMRIFKGFNDYKALNSHIKLAALIASYQHNSSYVENRLTLTDKNNHSIEFFYPTFSQYFETNLGKWIFNLKDQANKMFFGLIPRHDDENVNAKSPDLGLTFERKDKIFTQFEQKSVTKFMLNQLPSKIIDSIDFGEWRNGDRKTDSRIYFQVILKSQGFDFLKVYTQEEINARLVDYLNAKRMLHIVRDNDINDFDSSLKNQDNNNDPDRISLPSQTIDPKIDLYIEKGQILAISSVLFHALHDAKNVSENTLTKLLKLNEIPLFSKSGIGFLISLLPEDKLEDYVYVKLEMSAEKTEAVNSEFGTVNYKMLYNEINTIQSRLSNRSYDLRISKDDMDIENTDTQGFQDVANK